MTSTRIERLAFTPEAVQVWGLAGGRNTNWPVVYTLDNDSTIYVGETLNAAARMRQHLDTPAKQALERIQVIVDDTFNKSACLDLESFLIRLFAGDGKYTVLNANAGVTNADYYDKARYQDAFVDVFGRLWEEGYFTRSMPAILNSDLYKLSPFKALTTDQAAACNSIVYGLFEDLAEQRPSVSVVKGEPGTGKTIVGIFLMKLLRDIQMLNKDDSVDESIFGDYFTEEYRDLLAGFRIGLVVPQQSLRESIKSVFRRTPALSRQMVLTPFDVADSPEDFDLLIVDEAHRLTQLAAQAHGTLTKRFRDIQQRFFGDDMTRTQLDWIQARSRHQVFLMDAGQRVRPADVPAEALAALTAQARVYPLATQMRVAAGSDYVGFIRQLLRGMAPPLPDLGEYDFQLFDDFDAMVDLIRQRDAEVGLSRLLAGYAWKWVSQSDTDLPDIELGSHALQWNRTTKDWVNSAGSVNEVGSIHTIQGYDLNYAGVIIGNDLRMDPQSGRIVFNRASYFDARGKANNKILSVDYSDDDVLELVQNIYSVLLTRGIRGTYVYVCDPVLREHLREWMPRPLG